MMLNLLLPIALAAQAPNPPKGPDDKRVYFVGTAHLDTNWLWTIQDTIREHIPNTLHRNFALIEKYPDYVFSFEGAFRYMLMKEYYPEDYARMKEYIAKGRWRVTGSWVDAVDTNIPSPESLIRQTLYGNGYWKKEFGKSSVDVFLPDCFGFGYALPSIEAHCGLKGFSTQKLTWGSAAGIPFDIGTWEGVDGSSVIAALDPGAYGNSVPADAASNADLASRVDKVGKASGVYVDYRYHGTGDTGGAPKERSVQNLQKAIQTGGPLKILSAGGDQLFRDLTPEQTAKLPHYNGELLLTTHGTGCYTAQTAMKRWNRKNELLADAAERAAVTANLMGGTPYPQARLNEAWVRFLWHQFHDDLTGTSIPEVYVNSWNDELISHNQFTSVLDDAARTVASGLDTRGEGKAVVVYNPLDFDRTETVQLVGTRTDATAAVGPDGRRVPVESAEGLTWFRATAPANGWAVYHLQRENAPKAASLSAMKNQIANERLVVTFDNEGEIASIFDKALKKELLRGPIRYELLDDPSRDWNAWEIKYPTVQKPPRGHLSGSAACSVRATMACSYATLEADGSSFLQVVTLEPGSDKVRVTLNGRWNTKGTLLKAAFALTSANPVATYDLGLGTIQRGNDRPEKYEVPAQQWADLTAPDGKYGVSILSESKYGWDKPDDGTLRLTLIHTGKGEGNWDFQDTNDLGDHGFQFEIRPHAQDWRNGTVRSAAALNQPLVAFETSAHPGQLGKSFSLLRSSDVQVMVKAMKKAEDSNEVIVRVFESAGKAHKSVSLNFASRVLKAREVDGQETPLSGAGVVASGKSVRFSLRSYQPRAFAVTLAPLGSSPAVKSGPIRLPYDLDVVSERGDWADGDFDGQGHTIAAELLPKTTQVDGISYAFGPTGHGELNALSAHGQTIAVPAGTKAVAILAASVGGANPSFPDWSKHVGQWTNRVIGGKRETDPAKFEAPYYNPAPIGWVGTHRHSRTGDDLYQYTYLFQSVIPVRAGANSVTLPNDPALRIMAASTVDDPRPAVVAPFASSP